MEPLLIETDPAQFEAKMGERWYEEFNAKFKKFCKRHSINWDRENGRRVKEEKE